MNYISCLQKLQVNTKRHRIRTVVDRILLAYDIVDLKIQEEKLDNIIKEIYKTKKIK